MYNDKNNNHVSILLCSSLNTCRIIIIFPTHQPWKVVVISMSQMKRKSEPQKMERSSKSHSWEGRGQDTKVGLFNLKALSLLLLHSIVVQPLTDPPSLCSCCPCRAIQMCSPNTTLLLKSLPLGFHPGVSFTPLSPWKVSPHLYNSGHS